MLVRCQSDTRSLTASSGERLGRTARRRRLMRLGSREEAWSLAKTLWRRWASLGINIGLARLSTHIRAWKLLRGCSNGEEGTRRGCSKATLASCWSLPASGTWSRVPDIQPARVSDRRSRILAQATQPAQRPEAANNLVSKKQSLP